MDKILTLQQFAQMVATSADIPADEAMSFITSLTEHIKGMLCDGEKAYLPGIGTFAAIEDKDGNATVVFAPDESFSESVNEPFAMFEPVELSDNAALDIAASEVQPPLQSSTDNGTTTPLSDDRHDDSAETDISAIPSDAATPKEPQQTAAATVTTERMPTDTPEITGAENTAPVSTAVPLPAPHDPTAPAAPTPQYRLGWLCHGIALGAIIGYLVAALVYINREMSDNEEYGDTYEETAEYTDSVISVTDGIAADSYHPAVSATADILCTDTVTVRRYITHMAKDYYGDRNFWVYIYEANKDVLGHPERTLPGTVVNIPTPSSIPANPSNPDDIKQARLLAAEIYARFQ